MWFMLIMFGALLYTGSLTDKLDSEEINSVDELPDDRSASAKKVDSRSNRMSHNRFKWSGLILLLLGVLALIIDTFDNIFSE